jgi:hypothetical protein
VHCGSFTWHFWILIVALTIYLAWRAVQLAVWLAGKV